MHNSSNILLLGGLLSRLIGFERFDAIMTDESLTDCAKFNTMKIIVSDEYGVEVDQSAPLINIIYTLRNLCGAEGL